jgi:hypothetical protein
LTSLIPRADIYDSKTLAVMDQAFAAICNVLRADIAFAILSTTASWQKLPNVVADWVIDPIRLRNHNIESLLVSHQETDPFNRDRRLAGIYRDNQFHARERIDHRARSKTLCGVVCNSSALSEKVSLPLEG